MQCKGGKSQKRIKKEKEVPTELCLLFQTFFWAKIIDYSYKPFKDIRVLQFKIKCKNCKEFLECNAKLKDIPKPGIHVWQFFSGNYFIRPSDIKKYICNHDDTCISKFEEETVLQWVPIDNFEEICPGFYDFVKGLVESKGTRDDKRRAFDEVINEFLRTNEQYELPGRVYCSTSNWDSIVQRIIKKVLYHSSVFIHLFFLIYYYSTIILSEKGRKIASVASIVVHLRNLRNPTYNKMSLQQWTLMMAALLLLLLLLLKIASIVVLHLRNSTSVQ